MTLRIEIIRTLDGLRERRLRWDALLASAPDELGVNSYAWVSSVFEHRVPPDRSWLCAFAYDGDDLVAVLPLVASRRHVLGIPWLVLETPHDDHAILIDLLARPGLHSAVLPELVRRVVREHRRVLCVQFSRILHTSPTIDALASTDLGWPMTTREVGVGSYLDSVGPFDEHCAGLSSKLRKNLRRGFAQLGQGATVTFDVAAPEVPDPRRLEAFLRLEATTWKGEAGTAIASSPALKSFYETLVERLAAGGHLQWFLLQRGEEIVAALMGVRSGRSLALWKTAYDQAYASVSPGNLMMERFLRSAFESDSITRVNCLSNAPWIARWNTTPEPHWRVRAYPPSAGPLAFGLLPDRGRALARRALAWRHRRHRGAQPHTGEAND